MRRSGLYAAALAAGLVAATAAPIAAAQAVARSAAPASSVGQHAVANTATLPTTPLAVGDRLLAGHELPARVGLTTTFSALFGVFCTSAANCWAVGERGNINTTLNLIQHWNGKTWRGAAVPSPAGTHMGDISELYAVRCLTTKDCWAVGIYSRGAADFAQALHWNGRKWSVTATPEPGGTANGDMTELFDSTCTSAKNCWAVGEFGLRFGKSLNLLLHWNGRRWSRSFVVNPAGTTHAALNSLSAVRCLSVTNCLADGYDGTTPSSTTSYNVRNQALHWNGKRWSLETTPNPGGTKPGDLNILAGLACGASNSCWGAGYYGSIEPTQTYLNEILHWNGKSWTKAVTPNPGGTSMGSQSLLFGAVCGTANNCWAIGQYDNKSPAELNEALHWNGRKWSLVRVPNPAGTAKGDQNTLEAVRCTSQTNCWAVGEVQPSGKALQSEILHWNGKKWTVH